MRAIYGFLSALSISSQILYFSWEPPPSYFLKINFDTSVLKQGGLRGAAFEIQNGTSSFLAASDVTIYDMTIPIAELWATWKGLYYAIHILRILHIYLEDD